MSGMCSVLCVSDNTSHKCGFYLWTGMTVNHTGMLMFFIHSGLFFRSVRELAVRDSAFQVQAVFMVSHVHKVVINLTGSSTGNLYDL